MLTIMKKELKSYFLSPIGYIFIGVFLSLISIFFCLVVIFNGTLRFQDMFSSVGAVLTFIIPILTMRTFAEERKNGTDILLFTSPRSITSIVLAKFFAAAIILIITAACTIIYYIILRFFGEPDFIMVLTSLLGFLLLGMAYISFGIFASSITENQMIAGMITIAFFIFTWFAPDFHKMFAPFSLVNLLDKFLVGVISITNIFTYITFTLMFMVLTIIFLQRRKVV